MPSFKIDRTTEDIHRELTAILREVKDPRVKDCLLSLVRVEVTNDLSYCTVYVSTMEGMDRTKNAVQGLKSAAGFIRRELGKRLSLRPCAGAALQAHGFHRVWGAYLQAPP